MSESFRIATFNAENLFTRPKVFLFGDKSKGDEILKKVSALQKELNRSSYDKSLILQKYNELKEYILIREDRGKLFSKGRGGLRVKANGRHEWDGAIELKRAKFSEQARDNTARVIKDVNADILAMVEIEDRITMHQFGSETLPASKKYAHSMCIDGNDRRGIDVGLYTKSDYEVGGAWTHIYDKAGNRKIFSRDCPEYEVFLPNGKPLYVLVNHLKSKGYGSTSTSNARRKAQATRIKEILREGYDLKQDYVVVCGDLNDTPQSDPLSPLLRTRYLYDVLKEKFADPADRWTYHYRKTEQIDYLLVSRPLRDLMGKAGVERRGIANLDQFTNGKEQSYSTVTHFSNQASDHGAVWADFRLD